MPCLGPGTRPGPLFNGLVSRYNWGDLDGDNFEADGVT